MLPIPSAQDQLTFLTKMENILSDGSFSASYKFALLLSLTSIACTRMPDADGTMEITREELGREFLSLYWQQSLPYSEKGVLQQNTGKQAKVINDISKFRNAYEGASLSQLTTKHPLEVKKLETELGKTVIKMPVQFLQNTNGYENIFLFNPVSENAKSIRLLSGVAYCLSRFSSFIQRYAQDGWVKFLRRVKQNSDLLGVEDDLEAFLFETDRQSLKIIADGLMDLENGYCFYCGHKIRSTPDVDHFVPFSLYSRDLGHNFVLSCPKCNRSKSDMLAAEIHLKKWTGRMAQSQYKDDLQRIANDAAIVSNYDTSIHVARWAYAHAQATNQQGWVAPKQSQSIDQSIMSLFQSWF